jgi:hypothetical protein
MSFSRINSGATITGSFVADADSYFEKARPNFDATAFSSHYLGGSRSTAITGTGYKDAVDYVDFIVPDSASSGGVFKAIVDVLCENVATTITPKIRNITDSSDAVVGSAHASTSWGSQTLAFTPTVGKTYRLMLVKSDDLFDCWSIGLVRRTCA